MPFVSLDGSTLRTGFTRPIVQALFVATCLLSVVSFYTTQQGMALYLSPWFATLASLGIQVSLVMVAWLIGLEKSKSVLLISVYVITALVSIAFSYVSLHRWFSSRERPAEIQRALYDELNATAGKTETLLAEAANKSRQYIVALEEMTAAERVHGHISKAGDSDPYLDAIRQSVAREAQSVGAAYREGAGAGVRYTAFERHTKLTQEALRELESARRNIADWRANAKPLDPTDQQLRRFRSAYDAVPWSTVEQLLGRKLTEKPEPPAYARFVDRSASSQEDLMLAFTELAGDPGGRNFFALALAAFIDIVVFLLAFASGPYLSGSPEHRWRRGAAAMDAVDEQVFVRGLLAKLNPVPMGLAAVAVDDLTPGERQFALALEGQGAATVEERDGRLVYLIDREVQHRILESLAEPGISMRAARRQAVS